MDLLGLVLSARPCNLFLVFEICYLNKADTDDRVLKGENGLFDDTS